MNWPTIWFFILQAQVVLSSKIIEKQQISIEKKKQTSIEAMHLTKGNGRSNERSNFEREFG